MNKKKVVSILSLAAILFSLSLFHVKNEICCMFVGNRYLGFPYQVISISKGTDSLEEAEKIYYLNDFALLSQGWKLGIDTMYNPPWALPFNILFCLAVGSGIIFLMRRKK